VAVLANKIKIVFIFKKNLINKKIWRIIMQQNNIKNDFLLAMENTYDAYVKYGARSNKKLIPIHKWFAQQIISTLGSGYSITSLGTGGEYILDGKYYPKTLDITIFFNKKPIVTLSFKFVTSNYKQNSNNYFENLLGETANIRRVGVGFVHFLVLRGRTPYLDKAAGNRRGAVTKTEILASHDIAKYIKLFSDLDFPHKPDVLGMAIIDIDNNNKPYFTDLINLGLDGNTIKILNENFNIETFIEKVTALCALKK
jgi:hypothetical protein